MNILDSLILNPVKRLLATAPGTSLYPITKGAINHLLPIYPTPMVYEPSSVLMPIGESRKSNTEMRHKN